MKPTNEQCVAIQTVNDGKDLKLNAFAGAGKTSTLVLIAKELNPKRGIYLAFNKSIAEEAKRKMPQNVNAKTFHSLAYGAMPSWMRQRFSLKEPHINEFCKSYGLRNIHYQAEINIFSKNDGSQSQMITRVCSKKISSYRLKRLVNLSLDRFMSSDDVSPDKTHVMSAVNSDLPELYDENKHTFFDVVKQIEPIIKELWYDYSDEQGRLPINNNHLVYFKYWVMSNPIINYDFILFDEAQDADPLMLRVLKQQKAQIIYVGDKHQQIYDWRGAINALDQVHSKELYLTQSFRFGQALADQCAPILASLGEANKFKGTDAKTIIDTAILSESQYKDYDAVLCRSNAEVILTIIELVSRKIRCNAQVDTRSIVETLYDMQELEKNTKLVDLTDQTIKIYSTKYNRLKFHSWEEFKIYMDDFNTDPELSITYRIYKDYGADEVVNLINKAKDKEGLTISTAHKSKGLEWDNVLIRGDFLSSFFEMDGDNEITHKCMANCSIYDHDLYCLDDGDIQDVVPVIRQSKLIQSELRLLYVTVTRAKKKVNVGLINPIFKDFFKFQSYLIIQDGEEIEEAS